METRSHQPSVIHVLIIIQLSPLSLSLSISEIHLTHHLTSDRSGFQTSLRPNGRHLFLTRPFLLPRELLRKKTSKTSLSPPSSSPSLLSFFIYGERSLGTHRIDWIVHDQTQLLHKRSDSTQVEFEPPRPHGLNQPLLWLW